MTWYQNTNLYLTIVIVVVVLVLCVFLISKTPKAEIKQNEKARKRDPHDFYRGELFEDTEPLER